MERERGNVFFVQGAVAVKRFIDRWGKQPVDQNPIQYRDAVLRDYFRKRNWDDNNEFHLKRILVLKSSQLLPQYPYVIDDEWEVQPNRTDEGRGDLVFTDGAGSYAVVEVKWIDLEESDRKGATKRTSNRRKRRKVEEQAIGYADALLGRWNDLHSVEAYIFTNQCDRPQLLKTLKKP